MPLSSRARVLVAAAILFAGIFAARLADPHPGSAIGFLYVLPIALLAVEFGRLAGVLAAALAMVLFAIWVQAVHPEVGVGAYFWRGIGYLAMGGLVGHMADQLRTTAGRAEAAARHFQVARDLLCTANFEGYLTQLNGSWEEVLGWSREELMSRRFMEFVHPDDRAETERETARLAQGDFTASFTNRYRAKDGGYRWIEWSSKADLEHGLIQAAARDVTERRAADKALREAEERFRRGFEDSAIGMAVVGAQEGERDVILAVNESAARIVGRPPEELVGAASVAELVDAEDADRIAEGMRQLSLEGSAYKAELRVVRADGSRVWVDLTTSLIRDDDGQPLYRLSQLVDIDARKRAEEQLRFLADHDPLSGVFNRRRFTEELTRELAHPSQGARRGAVLLLDIDGFKQVNDTAGHAAGDALIARLGEVLTGRLRTSDVVARLGGDEFAALLRRVEPDDAVAIATEIRELAAADVTVSVGVATFGPGEAFTPDELLKRADHAMYEAKRAGGNGVYYGSSDSQTRSRSGTPSIATPSG